jgi:regulator of cell morphogenesis and NO signaling
MNTSSSQPPDRRSLSDLVADNVRATAVLERYGLDYCCHGEQTLEEAVRKRGVPLAEVVRALAALGASTPADRHPDEWNDLGVLTRHIVETHHRYVRDTTPVVSAWLDKLTRKHGAMHPELEMIRETFGRLGDELAAHMTKEENILFPFIDDLAHASRTGGRPPRSPFGTLLNPVRVMETDHELAGQLLDDLRRLTGGFTPPRDGCETYRLCFRELERFSADLHRHVHLENNVLFPRALDLEEGLS